MFSLVGGLRSAPSCLGIFYGEGIEEMNVSESIPFLLFEWVVFLAPFLEESSPMASAIGSPQVATTGATEAAIVPPVVAAASASDARSSGNINQRRTSEKRNKCKKKNAEKWGWKREKNKNRAKPTQFLHAIQKKLANNWQFLCSLLQAQNGE